jgi:hypothetical protein
MRMPEKVLNCGHAMCDTCLKSHGSKDLEGGYAFKITDCPICGTCSGQSFRLIPPTAGIRLLSVDGGGVRGMVPIIFLSHLEKCLEMLGCPLSEYFDLVCGTSAGKSSFPSKKLKLIFGRRPGYSRYLSNALDCWGKRAQIPGSCKRDFQTSKHQIIDVCPGPRAASIVRRGWTVQPGSYQRRIFNNGKSCTDV